MLYTLLPTPIYTPTPKCIHVYSFELAPIYRLSTLIGGACSEHFPFPPAHPYLLALWLSALPFHFPTALSFPFPLHFAFWPQCISLQCPSHFLLMPINAPARSFNAHVFRNAHSQLHYLPDSHSLHRMQLGLGRFTLLCGSSQSPRCWLMLAYSLLLLLGML